MSSSSPSLREAFAQPAALTMFFFGFTSGLPFLLVGGTLSAWLKESGVSLEDIGLMSLAGLAYSLKFLWSPAVDRVRLPLRRAGRRVRASRRVPSRPRPRSRGGRART